MIGLARDGHIILGPYNSDGHSWSCDDHDVCNGAFVDGQYVYVSTETFPYVIGCWGPGPQQTTNVSCSSNSCPKSSTSNAGKASLTASCNSSGAGSNPDGNTATGDDFSGRATPGVNSAFKQAFSFGSSVLIFTGAFF